MYKRNMEARSYNRCCSGKTISIIYCECVFRLSYPACNVYAPYCHLWPARLYGIFAHYLINDTIFAKKLLDTKWWDLIFSTIFCRKHFSLWEELSEIWSKMYIGVHVKCLLFLYDFNETLTFSTVVRKIHKCQILWQSVQCEPSFSMRTYGRTDGQTWRI